MPKITICLPNAKIPKALRTVDAYGVISRSPLSEICYRAVYWGGTWGLHSPIAGDVPGRKTHVGIVVPDIVAAQWWDWINRYGGSSTSAANYLCTRIALPPLPIDWQLGAVAASEWYQNRSVLALAKGCKPKMIRGCKKVSD